MAYSECGGLLADDGQCPVCVAPELHLDRGAVREVKLGGALVLPLIFANATPISRPLFVSRLWLREGDGERRPQDLAWERLDAGRSIPWSLQTSPLEKSGRLRLEISFAVATRYRWREEAFAFLSALELDVEQGGGIVINQTIHSGEGATNFAPIRIEADALKRPVSAASERAAALPLVRGDQFERVNGVRGYPDGATAPRSTRFVWRGFAPGEAPKDGPIVTEDSLIALGRSPLRPAGGESDVRLLVRDAAGAVDEALSRAVSRRHADLFVQSGRLCLHVAGEAGVRINDRVAARDAIETLADGDVVDILPKHPGAIRLGVRMRAHHNVIDQVTITRTPAAGGAAS
jgi:molybdopterin converting factor small subunit